uniref:Coiled-coil and C2 domain containing 2B n=1 Tax=Varanus komodoensis TaxID=61221 RepID=A0A8D2J3D9_VARKO
MVPYWYGQFCGSGGEGILEREEKQLDYENVHLIFFKNSLCKLANNMLPRFLEEEGFYMPQKPYISRNAYHKMENRLLQQEGKGWFEESGEIMSLPSPIKLSNRCRVPFPVKIDTQLKTKYKKSGDQSEIYQLDLNIANIVFSHHSLFNYEHVLAARLLHLYECFQKRQQQNVTHLLSEKLKALISATTLAESNFKENQRSKNTLKDYRSQIRNTRMLYDAEHQKDNSLIQNMLKVWKQIKSVRKQQGFISTPVKLQFQRNAVVVLESVKMLIYFQRCLNLTHVDQTSVDLGERNEPLFIPHLTFLTEISHSLSVSLVFSALRNSYSGNGTGMWWHSDIQKVMDWAKQTKIDPNDPDYSDLFELIMYAKTQEQSDSKYFRLEQLQEEFNFVTAEEIKNCKRFQLLQLRSLGQLGFYCFQQIPLYDREIPDTVFQKQVTKRIVTIRHKYNLSDIVSDYEEIISMSQLSNAIFKLGERRRHLKPQRKERRKVPAQAVSDGDVKLLIRILRAYNIPARKAPGTNSPGHDYTFSGLSKIKDIININIFDEFVIEKHEICGTFQVNTPPILLGYTWSKTYVPPKEDCNGQNLKDYTFLTIFVTIEPQLSSAENNLQSDKLSDHENETLLQRAYIFKQTCKALFPKRRIVTSVFNHQGKSILVTKYITSLNPPQLLLDMYPDDPNSTSDLISRFVSLIPCISDSVDESDDVDIWITSEDCLKLGVANKEEHAVLLCNYFLYVGKKAWILLGTSVLEGKVAYVATQENGEYFLWNPLNGQCYKQFDAFCPLQSIDCLISWENVWFNIQQNSSPMYVSFDISKEGFWKQLFPYYILDLKSQPVQVTGFPIQMPYLDMKSITEAVYQTGIHSSEVPNTEFALAVYIHPYPNTMLSVWIYLVSLVHHHK